MCVMTFGAACSPCAANYVKTVNALEYQNGNGITARAVKAILDYHYVDDFVDSFSSEEEALAVSQQVRSIHLKAGFEIRNFTSNSTNVVAALGGTDVTRMISTKDGVSVERVLGLFWQSSSDCFGFRLKFHNVDTAVVNGARCPTKRELLSVVMSIFDPLGLLSNFVIGAKLLMREVWRHNIGWDEPLPDDVDAAWKKWCKQLPAVATYAIPRFYFRNGAPHELQLHIFVDASEDAFAAVAYWRSQNLMGEIEVVFVSAKSKCAPTKTLTVPRLELQAAVLGTRLMHCLRNEHSVNIENCILWSDSKTVIKWIQSEHRRYKPFVQHRVAEILAVSNTKNWRWLPTAYNVADEATRTNDHIDFSPTARWSRGPKFLQEAEHTWPSEDNIVSHDEPDEELRPKFAMVIVKKYFSRYISHAQQDGIVWFDYNGVPLKPHYPIGVLYDQLHSDEDGVPWNLTIHFSKFPEDMLVKVSSRELLESHFMACLKEADVLKHRGQIISSMQKKDHNQLWQGLSNDKFDQFWAINRRLMEPSGDQDTFKCIPIRLYAEDDVCIQKLITPLNKNGQKKTISELMVELSTPSRKIVEIRTHGINVHEDGNLQWLSEHLSYPDNFLHLFLIYESNS